MYSNVHGVEINFYLNKVIVDLNFETSVMGLHAIGDGASVTRRLMQASSNGISVARHILEKYKIKVLKISPFLS